MIEIQGIILAGGNSSRMGTDKGLLPLNGKTMIENIISALSKITADIMIISGNKDYEAFGLPVHADLIPACGPAGGLYTGLSKSKSKLNLLLGCDFPMITSTYLEWLIEQYQGEDVLISGDSYGPQPLIGIYEKQILAQLKRSIEVNELKMMDFIEKTNFRIVKAPDEFQQVLKNVNTRAEYQNLKNVH